MIPVFMHPLIFGSLGHTAKLTVETLNKDDVISLSSSPSLLSSSLCSSCQLGKSHRLSFSINEKHSAVPFELIHFDLRGPSPIVSSFDF